MRGKIFNEVMSRWYWKILAFGEDKLEQSDLAEFPLIITEAAVDYCKPTQTKRKYKALDIAHDRPVVLTKVDRIWGVNNNMMAAGAKVPWKLCLAPFTFQ